MLTRLRFIVLAVVLALGLVSAYGATSVKTGFRLANLPPFVVTAACGTATSVAITGVDGSPSRTKRSLVQKWTINGNEIDVLIRVEHSHGQIWLDLISDASITSLGHTANSLNLATIAPGHPSPTKDAIDAAAITDAGD